MRHVEHVMGTVFSFDVRHEWDDHLRAALGRTVEELHRIDRIFSTYRADSHISRLRRGEIDLASCPPDVGEVLALCDRAERLSGGFFTGTPDGRPDPTGLVKGWAIERASRLLDEAGLDRHCINGGGDIRLGADPTPARAWRVGISHPLRPGTLATIVAGRETAIATSGVTERGHHVIDPHTGNPAEALASITVVGTDTALVDAFATAALAMGATAREWVEDMNGLEALAVTPHGETWRTSGFAGADPTATPGAGPATRRNSGWPPPSGILT
jgi:thiamine biosynthesis lipoprotein